MNRFMNFITEEDGLSTIEIGIILAVLVALAIALRKQIAGLWESVLTNISKQEQDIINDPITDAKPKTSG